jgi:hypothetical protein
VGLVAFAGILTTFVAVSGAQVLYQGFFPPNEPPRVNSCREGLGALIRALDRASLAPGSQADERKRLGRFRNALLPEWNWRVGMESVCRNDSWALTALDSLDRLRYAEEQSVRLASDDLAPSRHQVDRIAQALGSSFPSPEGSSTPAVDPQPSSF